MTGPQAFAPGSVALRYFQAVARIGSFRRAAAEVRIAPSALSRQVRILERELGAALLERARDGVRPTPAGEALLHRLARAGQELEAGRAEIRALQGTKPGHVVLGTNTALARELMPGFLTAFRAECPSISIEVVVDYTPPLFARLTAAELDIVVGYGEPADATLTPVMTLELVTCLLVQRQHRLARLGVARIEDLAGETMILPDEKTPVRQAIEAVLARAASRPLAPIVTGSTELTGLLVDLGLGVGVQNRFAPGSDVLRPGVVYVPFADPALKPVSLVCCIRGGRPPVGAAAACLDLLVRSLGEWARAAGQPPA